MDLEIRINNLIPQENLTNEINNLLVSCINYSKISKSDIDKIIIADKHYYSSSINSIDPNETHTSNNILTGVGKTIPIKVNDNIINNIVFNSVVFDACFYGFNTYANFNEWDPGTYIMYYIIHHEFAHCYDNITRLNFQKPLLRDDDNLFKIKNVSNYYFNILIGEYSACFYSAYSVLESMINYEISNFNSYIKSFLLEIATRKNKYKIDSREIYNIAFNVSELFWFILVQYSKLNAYITGNSVLSDVDITENINLNSDSKNILRRFQKIINQEWNYYPNISSKLAENCKEIWYELCFANGYKFDEEEKGDSIFWNN
jgi:hypothetical protein